MKPKPKKNLKLSESDDFWCDLAIALGYTVGELQERLTESEYFLWLRYRHKYGPLNPVRKYDRPAALVATLISNTNGGKSKPIDFLPYGKEETVEQEIGADDFVNLLKATGAKIGR